MCFGLYRFQLLRRYPDCNKHRLQFQRNLQITPVYAYLHSRNPDPLLVLEQSNSLNETVRILIITRHILPINCKLESRPNSVGVVESDSTGPLDASNAALADRAITLVTAACGVVVEERVESSAVDVDGLGVDNSETPAVDCLRLSESCRHEAVGL